MDAERDASELADRGLARFAGRVRVDARGGVGDLVPARAQDGLKGTHHIPDHSKPLDIKSALRQQPGFDEVILSTRPNAAPNGYDATCRIAS